MDILLDLCKLQEFQELHMLLNALLCISNARFSKNGPINPSLVLYIHNTSTLYLEFDPLILNSPCSSVNSTVDFKLVGLKGPWFDPRRRQGISPKIV